MPADDIRCEYQIGIRFEAELGVVREVLAQPELCPDRAAYMNSNKRGGKWFLCERHAMSQFGQLAGVNEPLPTQR